MEKCAGFRDKKDPNYADKTANFAKTLEKKFYRLVSTLEDFYWVIINLNSRKQRIIIAFNPLRGRKVSL